MAWFMGIDIGSEAAKGAITKDGAPAAEETLPSGYKYGEVAESLRVRLLEKAGISFDDVEFTVATGQGRESVSFSDEMADDIRCAARGINSLFPNVRTIIDVQGQSSRIIHVNELGQVGDFVVSEKCAAGSGQFLNVIGNVLRIDVDDIGELSLKAKNPVRFTTGCVVFWETEAISRVSEGFSREDILAGVHRAMAEKIVSLIERIGLKEECAVSGGGGLDIGLVKSIRDELGVEVRLSENPQTVTALGAAVMAAEISKRAKKGSG